MCLTIAPIKVLNCLKGLILSLFVFSSLTSFSQELGLSFRHLGEAEDLKYGHNNFIYKDDRGFVWISSEQGVFRFDGNYLKHYNISQDSFNNENIQSVFFEDKNENLWFTSLEALYHYNRKTDRFQGKQFYRDTFKLDTDYHAFHLENDSTLWLFADSCMWAYNTQIDSNTIKYLDTSGKRFTVGTTSTGKVNRIFAFPWIINEGFEYWTHIEGEGWKMDYQTGGILDDAYISKGLLENDSILWLISNLGLIEFNIKRKKVVGNPSPPKGTNVGPLTSGVFYKKNLLVLSSSSTGLWSFDTQKKTFKSYKEEMSLASNNLFDLNLDQDSQVWVTQSNLGLDYTIPESFTFDNPLKEEGSFKVTKIVEDHHQKIWVLTGGKGLFVFDLSGQLLDTIREINGEAIVGNTHLSIDDKGNIWLINKTKIYCYLEPSDDVQGGWKSVYEGKEDDKFLSLYHGVLDQTILISQKGVFNLEETGSEVELSRPKYFKNYSNYEFDHFFKANEKLTFLPYNSNDLWIWDHFNDTMLFVKDKIGSGIEPYSVLQSRDSTKIWVAGSTGLLEFNGVEYQRTLFGKKHLKGNSSVYSVVEDAVGRLWLSTNTGIWSYYLGETLNYNELDGISSDLFSQSAGLLASDGKIWFGNKKGLSVFHPDSISVPVFKGDVYIEEYLMGGQLYEGDICINELEKISMNYDESTFSFELRIVETYLSKGATLKYRLKGYEEGWTKIKNGGRAQFTQVKHGDYELEVIPIDAHNKEGEKKILLAVEITIPFFKKLWVRLTGWISLVFLIIALVIRYYYIKKLRRERRLLERQKTINEERDRISKELHDDMGGGLSSILFISEDLRFEEKNESKLGQVNRISELTKDALGNMKDIIWALDTEQSSLEDLFSRFQTFATKFLSDHQIEFKYNLNLQKDRSTILGSEKKRNILLILKECLHNIVKHAAAKSVEVIIHEHITELEIIVKDDGKGFEMEKIKSSGYGLNNLEHRSKIINGVVTIQSAVGKGTEIKLVVTILEPV